MRNVQYRSERFMKTVEYACPQYDVTHRAALRRATALLFVILLLSSVGFAQEPTTASASVAFDFWAQGQEFRAGDYVFDNGYPGSVSIRRKGSGASVAVAVIIYGDPVEKQDAKLLFVSRDGKYYLTEIWCVQDRRVVTAEFDHRGQLSEQTRQVSLMYP